MIERCKKGKIWYRSVCTLLSVALCVCMLSGCRSRQESASVGTKTAQTYADTENGEITTDETESQDDSDKIQTVWQTAEKAVTDEADKADDVMTQLSESVSSGDADRVIELADTLSGQLDSSYTAAEEWQTALQEVSDSLDDEARTVYEEREKAFNESVSESRDEASALLAGIKESAGQGDMETAAEQTDELTKLLGADETYETYGEDIPDTEPVHEAETAEYNVDADTPEASSVMSEDESEKTEYLALASETELLDTVKEKADELKTPLAVYNYIKNNIGYETYHGSRKGANGTYDAMSGNDYDQASLLIAMLRYLGYPSAYVKGTIDLTPEQAVSLTGADTAEHAADVLAAAGTPVTKLTLDGELVYVRMEHVWVRSYIPYTDYRGAGDASGSSVWLDLDTEIKSYENVDNIYDALDDAGFNDEVAKLAETGDASQMDTLLDTWEEKLGSMDTDSMYTRKRIISQKEESYLPASLQYATYGETVIFAEIPDSDRDKVSFGIDGDVFTSFTASELYGKSVLLAYEPATDADKAIYDSYDSIFDVPAYAVYMKPVIYVDGEVTAEGDEYLEITLGTKQTFTIGLSSALGSHDVTNDVTTGSMYAVTLDMQSITSSELQEIYDEASALSDSVTETNVYSTDYLGKLLTLAGRLYFAQVDMADIMTAEAYGVTAVRDLSEGITGYELRCDKLYGQVSGLSEGSLYIDVDTDRHSVISLTGDEDASREYMLSTGMMGSLYESTVWEELTGYESVSTISILAAAQEKGIELLLISSANMAEEMEKLNTTDTTKQAVTEAVNAGKIVTIPAEDMTIGSWSGTGYMVIDPETGAGAYMISGGLNGGSLSALLTLGGLCATFSSAAATSMLVWAAVQFFALTLTPLSLVAYGTMLGLLVVAMIELNYEMWTDNLDYLFTGDLSSAEQAADVMGRLGNLALVELGLSKSISSISATLNNSQIKYYVKLATKNKESDTCVLGTTGKYNVYASDNNYTYFILDESKWSDLVKSLNNNYNEIWKINKQYIDNQIKLNKTIILTDNPELQYLFGDGSKRFYQREIDYLSELGYTFSQVDDELWKAILE